MKCFFGVHVGNDEKMFEYTRLESREVGREGIKMEARGEHTTLLSGKREEGQGLCGERCRHRRLKLRNTDR